MPFCVECGTENTATARECTSCRSPIFNVSVSTTAESLTGTVVQVRVQGVYKQPTSKIVTLRLAAGPGAPIPCHMEGDVQMSYVAINRGDQVTVFGQMDQSGTYRIKKLVDHNSGTTYAVTTGCSGLLGVLAVAALGLVAMIHP